MFTHPTSARVLRAWTDRANRRAIAAARINRDRFERAYRIGLIDDQALADAQDRYLAVKARRTT